MSPRALAATLPKLTRPVLEKRGRTYATLIAEWSNMVGAALAEVSLPERLTPNRTDPGAVLTVRVSGPGAVEFQHLEPQIIDRINTFLGFSAVTRLKFIQGPVPGRKSKQGSRPRPLGPAQERAVAAAVADIPDPELQAALGRLGRAVIGSRPSRTDAKD